MSRKRIVPTKSLLLGAKMTPHLHLAVVVDRIFVSSKVVRSGEYRIAGLACTWVGALASVRTSLGIALCNSLSVGR